MRRTRLIVTIAALAALAACGKSSPVETANSAQSLPAQDQTSTTSDLTMFCSEVSGERPEAYVGSPENLADVTHATAIAPPEIRPQMQAVQSFLASGGIDPNNPDSRLTTNWPPAVQTAATEIKSYLSSHC